MSFARITLSIFFVICASLLSVGFSFAQQQSSMVSAEGSLGKVDFPVSCSPAVQSQFNRGLALLHHMMYTQAEKEFKTVSELDPDCAMAHWGIAMTLFHPLWAGPTEEELKRGWAAVEKAKALKPPTEREQGYVAAVEAFYKNWKTVDHPTRIAAWEASAPAVL